MGVWVSTKVRMKSVFYSRAEARIYHKIGVVN